MEKYILKKPINFDGEKIEELEFELDELTCKDLSKCERETKMRLGKKENITVPEINSTYLMCVAARASKVQTELIESLYAKDATQIKMMVQNFLLDGESEEEIEEMEEPLSIHHMEKKLNKPTTEI